jgi:serine/threonine protein kinase
MSTSTIYCHNCGAENQRSENFCFACGSALTNSGADKTVVPALTGQVQAHTLLHQRYRVLQIVGQGGMGAVYLAEDTQLGDRHVAVKEMSQSNLYGQQAQNAVANFKNEAHLLASLQHPNLPGIHDYFTENGRWYLVMSFIKGETLADYLAHTPNSRLSLEEVLTIGRDLCNVLNYLHGHQPPIIFRDLKPTNIMRSADGHIYLIDFGIARHFKPGQSRDTAAYGSMGYSPPEQYGQAQTTERSDIYSLGATLYQCLSGYEPSSSPFRLPPLSSLVPGLPERLTQLITQMLELDESKRPENVRLVQQELAQIAAAPLVAYAPPPPPRSYTPVTPFPATQYAVPPPPPIQYPLAQPTPLSLQQSMYSLATPVQKSQPRSALSIIGLIFSVIGVILGAVFAVFGILGMLIAQQGIYTNVWVGVLVFFFGLMLISLSLMRRTTFPISRPRKAKAVIGRFVCWFAIAVATLIIIFGALTNVDNNDHASGIIGGVFSLIEGLIIWLATRIWRKGARQRP